MARPDMKFLVFHLEPNRDGRKTNIWTVLNHSGSMLGEIKWYPAWRRYCFYPHGMLCADAACLAELREFLIARMLERSTTT